MRIVMLPGLMLTIVVVIFLAERCSGSTKAASHAKGNMFL